MRSPTCLHESRVYGPENLRSVAQKDFCNTICQLRRLPDDYSITSSASASSVGGNSRPSTLAVCRLMANSNFAGSRTDRSHCVRWSGRKTSREYQGSDVMLISCSEASKSCENCGPEALNTYFCAWSVPAGTLRTTSTACSIR